MPDGRSPGVGKDGRINKIRITGNERRRAEYEKYTCSFYEKQESKKEMFIFVFYHEFEKVRQNKGRFWT